MRFGSVIDAYIRDFKAQGRINSPQTEVSYRYVLNAHAEDVGNRDPRLTGREDVKRTLRRWTHPNTQRHNRSVLISFYGWMEEEGLRDTNPARQTPRPRKRKPTVYRLTKGETVEMLRAVRSTRERRAIFLGICAGLRSQELRGLQGRHFEREQGKYLWVSPDIGKGNRERWIPVLPELELVVAEIRRNVGSEEYVLPAQRFRDPGINRAKWDKLHHPCSPQALYYLVKRVGKRAGIAADVHPHLLRHAFATHITRSLGLDLAQALMGHATIETTREYLSEPSLDELSTATHGFSFGLSPSEPLQKPLKAPTDALPVLSSSRTVERLSALIRRLMASEELRGALR